MASKIDVEDQYTFYSKWIGFQSTWNISIFKKDVQFRGMQTYKTYPSTILNSPSIQSLSEHHILSLGGHCV